MAYRRAAVSSQAPPDREGSKAIRHSSYLREASFYLPDHRYILQEDGRYIH